MSKRKGAEYLCGKPTGEYFCERDEGHTGVCLGYANEPYGVRPALTPPAPKLEERVAKLEAIASENRLRLDQLEQAPAQAEEGTWVCPSCAYRNALADLQCGDCDRLAPDREVQG